MTRQILCFFTLFFAAQLITTAQVNDSINQQPEPIGGVERLALTYYKIDFDSHQRQLLEGTTLEFIFLVDTPGEASLQEVNGINIQSIVDSLMNAKNLPAFRPQITDGIKEQGFYFMKLSYPKYNIVPFYHAQRFGRFELEDVEFYTKKRVRLDILVGGAGNFFAGQASEHLSAGGGMKLDMVLKTNGRVGFGLVLAFFGNYMKKDYPINTTRQLENAPMTGFIGTILYYQLLEKNRTEWNVQLEPSLLVQNVSTTKFQGDEPIQLSGFSPGVIVNYFLKLGRERFLAQWTGASIQNHAVNLHAGVRPLLFDYKPARGVMFELGISYRLSSAFVYNYQLKNRG